MCWIDYYGAAKAFHADVIVRITSDCPLMDPDVIDRIVHDLVDRHPRVDYVSNTLPPRSFPRGLDVEAMWMKTLERAWREDGNPLWREHVTPYIYHHPDRFTMRQIHHEINLSGQRWTLDTREDYELLARIYQEFGHAWFTMKDVVQLLAAHPEWVALNQAVKQKEVR